MEQKIIFFDIDGTLVNERDRTIPDSAVRAIRRARERGHLVYINSGRPYCGIDPRIKAMGFDGYACGCGINIRAGDKVLFHQKLDKVVQLRCVELVRQYGLQVMMEGAGHVYFDLSRPLDPNVEGEKAYYDTMGLDTNGDPAGENAEFDKFVVWTHPGADKAGFYREVSPWFDVIEREGALVEFVPHGCSKGKAMERLMAYYGLTRENCVAVGDSTNDLPMLEAAGISVAMGNGDPRIFDRVTYVTEDITRDGVLRALEHFDII